ncbi:MAG: helix-turn-helix domain-containing protein [Bacteroidota bacterium]
MNLTIEKLPQAVHQLSEKLEHIERLLSSSNQVQQPEADRWFDINELCEYLPEKPVKSTVYTMVRERRLPFHKRGKKLAFLKSEIDQTIKSGKVKSRAEIEQEAEDFLVSKGGRK